MKPSKGYKLGRHLNLKMNLSETQKDIDIVANSYLKKGYKMKKINELWKKMKKVNDKISVGEFARILNGTQSLRIDVTA